MSRISLHLSSHSQTDPVSPNRHSLQHHHHSLQYTQLQLRLQDEEVLAHRPLSHRCSRRSILPQLSPPRCPSSRRGSLRRPEPQGLRHRLYPTRLDMLPQPRRRMSSYSLLRSWNEPAVRMLSQRQYLQWRGRWYYSCRYDYYCSGRRRRGDPVSYLGGIIDCCYCSSSR